MDDHNYCTLRLGITKVHKRIMRSIAFRLLMSPSIQAMTSKFSEGGREGGIL